jgi:hypothetical protein
LQELDSVFIVLAVLVAHHEVSRQANPSSHCRQDPFVKLLLLSIVLQD